MNGIITELMNSWGFQMPDNIFTPMVYIISTIAFCLVFWIISKIACPDASSMRTFVLKYVCIVMAIVVCLFCVSSNGIKVNLVKNEVVGSELVYSYSNESTYQTVNLEEYPDGIDIINEENINFNGIICVNVLLAANYETGTIGAIVNGSLIAIESIIGACSLLVDVNTGDSVVITLIPDGVDTAVISVSYYTNIAIIAST